MPLLVVKQSGVADVLIIEYNAGKPSQAIVKMLTTAFTVDSKIEGGLIKLLQLDVPNPSEGTMRGNRQRTEIPL